MKLKHAERQLNKRLSFLNGRYWIRTSDPFRVKEVRYHCANRPHDWILDHRPSDVFGSEQVVMLR